MKFKTTNIDNWNEFVYRGYLNEIEHMLILRASKIEGVYRWRNNNINGITELRKSKLTFIIIF